MRCCGLAAAVAVAVVAVVGLFGGVASAQAVSPPAPPAAVAPNLVVCGAADDELYNAPSGLDGVVFYGGAGQDGLLAGGSGSGHVFFGGAGADTFDAAGSGSGHVFFGGAGADSFLDDTGSGSGHVFFGGAGDDTFDDVGGSGSGHVFFGGPDMDSFTFTGGTGQFAGAVETPGAASVITDGSEGSDPEGPASAECGTVCVSKVSAGNDGVSFDVTLGLGLVNGAGFDDLGTPGDEDLDGAGVTSTLVAAGDSVCFALAPEVIEVRVSETPPAPFEVSYSCSQGGVPLVEGAAGAFAVEPSAGMSDGGYPGDATTTPGDISCVVTNTVPDTTGVVEIVKTVAGGAGPDGGYSFAVVGAPAGCTQTTAVVADAAGGSVDVTVRDFVSTGESCGYTVSETVPDGCSLVGDNGVAAVGGDTVAFANVCALSASITITKTVAGSGGPDGGYTFGVVGEPASCTQTSAIISSSSGGTAMTAAVVDVDPVGQTCSYAVTETVPDGCSLVGDNGVAAVGGDTVAFANVCPGADQVLITKTWNGVPVDSTFTVAAETQGCPGSTVILAGGDTSIGAAVTDVGAGTGEPCVYTVTEVVPAGYAVNPAAGYSGVAPGGSVAFTNTQLPADDQITITKTWVGGNAGVDLVFTVVPEVDGCTSTQQATIAATTSAVSVTVADVSTVDAAPCTYAVTETEVAGWVAQTATMGGVAPGNAVTFTNTRVPPVVTPGPVVYVAYPDGGFGDLVADSAGEDTAAADDSPGAVTSTQQAPHTPLAVTGGDVRAPLTLVSGLLSVGFFVLGVARQTSRKREAR